MAAIPKPEPRRRQKAREDRRERAVVKAVRTEVEIRERAACRLVGTDVFGPCEGVWEWAHFDDSKRFKTVGQPPEERHTTAGSLGLCTRHHKIYDGRVLGAKQERMKISALTEYGCDGELRFEHKGVVYVEDPRF